MDESKPKFVIYFSRENRHCILREKDWWVLNRWIQDLAAQYDRNKDSASFLAYFEAASQIIDAVKVTSKVILKTTPKIEIRLVTLLEQDFRAALTKCKQVKELFRPYFTFCQKWQIISTYLKEPSVPPEAYWASAKLAAENGDLIGARETALAGWKLDPRNLQLQILLLDIELNVSKENSSDLKMVEWIYDKLMRSCVPRVESLNHLSTRLTEFPRTGFITTVLKDLNRLHGKTPEGWAARAREIYESHIDKAHWTADDVIEHTRAMFVDALRECKYSPKVTEEYFKFFSQLRRENRVLQDSWEIYVRGPDVTLTFLLAYAAIDGPHDTTVMRRAFKKHPSVLLFCKRLIQSYLTRGLKQEACDAFTWGLPALRNDSAQLAEVLEIYKIVMDAQLDGVHDLVLDECCDGSKRGKALQPHYLEAVAKTRGHQAARATFANQRLAMRAELPFYEKMCELELAQPTMDVQAIRDLHSKISERFCDLGCLIKWLDFEDAHGDYTRTLDVFNLAAKTHPELLPQLLVKWNRKLICFKRPPIIVNYVKSTKRPAMKTDWPPRRMVPNQSHIDI